MGGAVHEAASLWDGVSRRANTGAVYWCVCKTRRLTMGGRKEKNIDEPQSQTLG